MKFNEDLKRYRQEGWTCVVCRELCKCKKCKKLVQEDLQKLDPSPQKPNDVVPYPMRGKRAFQVDNFVILEETFSHEERKAKQAAKKAVQQQPAKRQSYHAEVFKTVSKRAVKRLKHNSNPGSYNSIRSESEEEPAPAPKPNPSRAFPTYSSAIPPVMGQQPPLGYTNVYPQMDLAASYAPGCYYITTEPRYYIPTVAPQQYVQQYVQQYTQQFNVMAPPSGYTMAPFAYYSMPQFKPVVPDQPQYRQPFTFSQALGEGCAEGPEKLKPNTANHTQQAAPPALPPLNPPARSERDVMLPPLVPDQRQREEEKNHPKDGDAANEDGK